MSNIDTITIDLGELGPRVQERIESGEYDSAGEVVRAGLEALEREEAALTELWRRKIQEAYDDPRPDVPMDDVFNRLERKYTTMIATAGREA